MSKKFSLNGALEASRNEYLRIYKAAGMTREIPEAPTEEKYFSAARDGDWLQMRINGVFDSFWGCNVREIIAEIDDAKPEKLHLLIESPGGIVSDGFALYTDLQRRVRNGLELKTEAVGIVASAAVLPFLAGEKNRRLTQRGCQIMVHNVWGCFFACGDADTIEDEGKKIVNAIRSLSDEYSKIVSERTGTLQNDVRKAMKDETWYNPEEAVEAGYASEVIDQADDDEDMELRGSLIKKAKAIFVENRLREGLINA